MTEASSGNSGLGFGLAFQLRDEFSQPAQQIQNSFYNLNDTADRLSRNIQNSLDRIYRGAAQVGVGVAMMLPVRQVITAFSEFDSLQRGMLAVMSNNINAVKSEIFRLNDVAKLPGLGFKEALQGSINLQAAGLSADLARRALMGFGNALATVGRGKAYLDGVNLALSQIMSKGKVMAQEINQIAERVPQIRVMMKNAFGTADTEVLGKMGLSSQQFIEKIVQQLEKLPQTTGGIKNAMENLDDTFFKMKVSIGRSLAPMVEYLGDKVSYLMEAVERFANTRLGSITVQVAGLFLAFTSGVLILRGLSYAFGGVLSLMGSLKIVFASVISGARLLWAALTLTSGGLTALGAAIRTAFLSNPITLALLVVTLAVMEMYKAWNMFTDLLEGKTKVMSGYMGFLQRMGGYLQALGEIFSTVTSQGWSMSKSMEDTLQRMGILDNVIALGTWIVRIREIFVGFGQAIGEAYGFASKIFGQMWDSIQKMLGSQISAKLSRLLSSISLFRALGASIGFTLGLVIRIVGVAMTVFVGLAGTVISFAINIVKGIGWVVGAIFDIFAAIPRFVQWAFEKGGQFIIGMQMLISEWVDNAYNVGANFVTSLWEGIKSMWDRFTGWITDKWKGMTKMFQNPFGYSQNQNINVNTSVSSAPPVNVLPYTPENSTLSALMANRSYVTAAPTAAMYNMKPTVIDKTTEKVKNVTVINQMDGKTINRQLHNINEIEDAREGF